MDHDVSALKHTPGMEITITGGDPYISGPSVGLPRECCCGLNPAKTARPGSGHCFIIQRAQANEADSVKFRWRRDGRRCVCLPPLGPDIAFRLDPPGTRGTVTFPVFFSERVLLKEPDWPKPEVPSFTGGSVSLTSGT